MHPLAFIAIHSFRPVPSRSCSRLSQSSICPATPLRSHPILAAMNPHSHPVITESTPLISTPNNTSESLPQPLKWQDVWSITSRYVIPDDRRSKLLAFCTLLAVLLRRASALVQPLAYKLAVDALASAIIPGNQLRVPYGAVGLYVLAQFGSTMFSVVQDAGYAYISSDYQKRFSVDLFAHLQSLSLAYHMHRKTGEVLKIMDRGENSIDTFTTAILFTLLPTLGEACIVTGIFFHLGTPFVALSVFLTVFVYFFFTISVTQWRIKLRRMVIEATNKVSEKAVDALINYETVKMFGMEEEEVGEYEDLRNNFQHRYIWLRLSLSTLNSGQSIIRVIGAGVAMLLAAIATARGNLTPGDFVLINAYVLQLFQPLLFLGSSYRQVMQALTDIEKAINIFKTKASVDDLPGAKTLVMAEEDVVAGKIGEVRFEDVTFTYGNTEQPGAGGIRNVSFHVPPGKMLAIVGKSGVGKSTIMRLLLRFYDVNKGKVTIDGEDVRSFTQRSLRRNMGVVAQDTILFNQSLRHNVSYGKKEAKDVEIHQAVRSAALTDFLDTLPAGLDTLVGERGIRLSGGERQRVGSARCIIKRPAIMLLDEASASLDTHTERQMQNNLRKACQNRATIVIAHRLSTVMMADEIIVLGRLKKDDLGTVVENGTHIELLKKGGVYAAMWEAQTAGSDVEDESK